VLITRITLRVITGYITLDYIIIIRKLIFVNQWSEKREYFRVLQANDCYRNSKTNLIIIVEESIGPFQMLEEKGVNVETNSEQAVKSLVTLGVPPDNIILLPGNARSTLDEAKVVRKYVADIWPADTLLLVSSAAHMRRASMIFKEAFRRSATPVYIGCSPSAYSSFNPDKWWRRKEDIQTVLTEYLKIGSFLLIEKRQLRKNP